jgi:DNA polymerase-3 subunit gamma/tau
VRGVSLALYRTYRPGRISDVIGQEHVTVPLARAIDSGRAHHAYLFTGPRGCGKTSTARILARSLNCEQGPTSQPCGVCGSCIDLAPNGPGSIDVVEMDAASHRGIDDARELREKAMYAPAASRYKVYIIDEAHQLTTDAANALLKLIEEPPAHLMFVFATTEPDKILATIRSRTHHYPYRLVPVRRLQEHLAWVCEQEGVPAQAEALALVARAGAGSVRDALSILGQLIAGTGPAGLTYDDTVAQLGVTDAALLDEVVEALAASDGPAMFSVVDRVVEAGLDPRRFATDLLERLRDLVVLHEVPDAVEAGLIDAPESQVVAMQAQTSALGLGQLSRAADLVSTGLTELKGATAPRLQLELLCARLLLPAADDTESGVRARVDRLERAVAFLGDAAAPTTASARPAHRPGPSAPATTQVPTAPDSASESAAPSAPVVSESSSSPPTRPVARASAHEAAAGGPPAPPRLSSIAPSTASAGPASTPAVIDGTPTDAGEQADADALTSRPSAGDAVPPDAVPPAPAASSGDLVQLTTMWPAVLEALKASSRVAHTLAEGAVPWERTESTLVLAHPDKVRMGILRGNKGHVELLRLAVLDVLRLDVEVDLVLDPSVGTGEPGAAPAQPAVPDERAPAARSDAAQPTGGPSARERAAAVVAEEVAPDADEVSVHDADADGDLSGLALVQRELGATVMTEYDNG